MGLASIVLEEAGFATFFLINWNTPEVSSYAQCFFLTALLCWFALLASALIAQFWLILHQMLYCSFHHNPGVSYRLGCLLRGGCGDFSDHEKNIFGFFFALVFYAATSALLLDVAIFSHFALFVTQ